MAGPAWLADSFAALMLLTALYCAGRLVVTRTRRRPTEQDVNLVHVLMGVAMAGMLAPAALPLPGPAQPGGTIWAGTWGLVFGVATAWFAGRIALSYRATGRLRPVGSHHLPHLIMSGTMVYMLATVARPAGLPGAGMAGAAGDTVHFPLLAVILAQFMVGYVMWTADRLPALARVRAWRPAPGRTGRGHRRSGSPPQPAPLSPPAARPALPLPRSPPCQRRPGRRPPQPVPRWPSPAQPAPAGPPPARRCPPAWPPAATS